MDYMSMIDGLKKARGQSLAQEPRIQSGSQPLELSEGQWLSRAKERERQLRIKQHESDWEHPFQAIHRMPALEMSMQNPSWAAWFEAADQGRTPLDQPINMKLRQQGTSIAADQLGDISNQALEGLKRQSQSFGAGMHPIFRRSKKAQDEEI